MRRPLRLPPVVFGFLFGVFMCSQVWASPSLMRWAPPAWGPLSPDVGLGGAAGRIADTQRIVVRGGHFYRPGPDQMQGTPDDVRMRWYGINVAGVAAFPPPEQAREFAQTLASWGFNAVRIHYIDAPPSPDPTVITSVLSDGPYPSFNPVAIGRLRRLLAELREHGLYVQLNPIGAYTLRPQEDGVPPLGTGQQNGGESARLPNNNPLAAIHPALLQRQQNYLTKLAQHLELAKQPALAQVDAVNESSLLVTWTQWDATQWQRTVSGEYGQVLSSAWANWAQKKYGNLPSALAAWGLPTTSALPMPTPSQPEQTAGAEQGTDPGASPNWWARLRVRLVRLVDYLPAGWRPVLVAWLQPAAAQPNLLLNDFLGFLAELDQRHFEALRTTLRSSIRADLPVTGTQVSHGDGWSTVSQAGMDFVDDHFYVDHYQFPDDNWNMANWYTTREALSGQAWSRLAGGAALRDRARPYVISELGQPYPNPLGPEMSVTLATLARLQDWDGLFLFDHDSFNPERRAPGHFDIQGDWPRAIMSALSSRIFLAGDFAPLTAYPAQASAALNPSAFTAAWLRQRRPDYWTRELQQTAPDAEQVQQLWGYGTPVAPTPGTSGAGQSPTAAPPAATMTRHNGSILTASWPNGIWSSGKFGGGSRGDMGGIRWALPVGEDEQSATVVLISGDGLPLQASNHWVLGIVTPTLGSRIGSVPPVPQSWARHPSGPDNWTLAAPAGAPGPSDAPLSMPPLWTEASRLRIELPPRAGEAQVWRLNAVGQRTAIAELVPGGEGWWQVPVVPPAASGRAPTMWFDIRWPDPAPKR